MTCRGHQNQAVTQAVSKWESKKVMKYKLLLNTFAANFYIPLNSL